MNDPCESKSGGDQCQFPDGHKDKHRHVKYWYTEREDRKKVPLATLDQRDRNLGHVGPEPV